jgi:hypothetical protein
MTALIPTTRSAGQAFLLASVLNTVWINLSEVFRYFAFVMPMMRDSLPQLPKVAPMNLPVFLIWGVWDTILVTVATGGAWLMLERFGNSFRMAILAGTAIWLGVFVILWLGLWNMNLATLPVLAVALPLALLEMIVAALIVRWAMAKAG